jgi:hypothetical protein
LKLEMKERREHMKWLKISMHGTILTIVLDDFVYFSSKFGRYFYRARFCK